MENFSKVFLFRKKDNEKLQKICPFPEKAFPFRKSPGRFFYSGGLGIDFLESCATIKKLLEA